MSPPYVRRVDMIKALTDANVQFDPEATVVVLRPLYDILMRNLQLNPDEENQRPTLQNTEANTNANLETVASGSTQQRQSSTADSGPIDQMMNMSAENVQNSGPVNESGSVANRVQPAVDNATVNILSPEEQEIEKQISVLKKKRELVALQRELQLLEYRRFDFTAFESMVNPFTGDDTYDVDKWLNDLEDSFAVFNCNDRDKLVAARRLIKGTAKVFLRTIRVNTYNELKEELITEFRHAYTAHEVYQQLKARTLQTSESVKHFVSIMVEIASHATVPESDLVDIIVDNLQDVIWGKYSGRIKGKIETLRKSTSCPDANSGQHWCVYV